MGPKIKIGREEIEMVPGEYLLYNGSCVQLITTLDVHKKSIKAGRLARWKTNYVIPKGQWKKQITPDKFTKVEVNRGLDIGHIKYMPKFTNPTDSYSDKLRNEL